MVKSGRAICIARNGVKSDCQMQGWDKQCGSLYKTLRTYEWQLSDDETNYKIFYGQGIDDKCNLTPNEFEKHFIVIPDGKAA